jgi:hypothetical protein
MNLIKKYVIYEISGSFMVCYVKSMPGDIYFDTEGDALTHLEECGVIGSTYKIEIIYLAR